MSSGYDDKEAVSWLIWRLGEKSPLTIGMRENELGEFMDGKSFSEYPIGGIEGDLISGMLLAASMVFIPILMPLLPLLLPLLPL
jgi:hypothetical protein